MNPNVVSSLLIAATLIIAIVGTGYITNQYDSKQAALAPPVSTITTTAFQIRYVTSLATSTVTSVISSVSTETQTVALTSASTSQSASTGNVESGILTVTCDGCTPEIANDSQYLVTIGWNMVYPNSGVDNVSEYQANGNGTTSYLVTTATASTSVTYWNANWIVSDNSATGGKLTATFALASGQVVYTGSTSLFPDEIQGNYSSS